VSIETTAECQLVDQGASFLSRAYVSGGVPNIVGRLFLIVVIIISGATSAGWGVSGRTASRPLLGRQLHGYATIGIGQVQPSHIDFGGTADSTLIDVSWSSWGGTQATGIGTWCPGGQECGTVKVVAFKPGECRGAVVYQALEWYLTQSQIDPGYAHSFDQHSYRDVCTETWVGE